MTEHSTTSYHTIIFVFGDMGGITIQPPLLFPVFFGALQNCDIEAIDTIAGKIEYGGQEVLWFVHD